jgi:hypothetical protein
MAMDPRKKKGVGFIVTAALFAVAGGVFIGTSATPDWLNIVFAGVSALAGVFGLVIIVPDTKD